MINNMLSINGDDVSVAKLPQQMSITNTATTPLKFVPYRENFVTELKPGTAINFTVSTAGQALYYMGQKTSGLVVKEEISSVVDEGKVTTITLPAKITLKNNNAVGSGMIESFIPYKENFQVNLTEQKSTVLVATTLGQVLYYLAQQTNGLTVAQEAIEAAAVTAQVKKTADPSEPVGDKK